MEQYRTWKTVLLILVTFILFCLAATFLSVTVHYYGEWMGNIYSVQDRLYEAVSMFFGGLLLSIPFVTLCIISIRALVNRLLPDKKTGKVALFVRKHSLVMSVGFAVLFVVFFMFAREAVYGIKNTVEISEVPAALRYYYRAGWFGLLAELTLEGIVISLFPWIINGLKRRKKDRNRV